MPARTKAAHIWKRETDEHYVEPEWCSRRLFDVEDFSPGIWDPCCGFGTIPEAAQSHGLYGIGTDIVDRGYADMASLNDFLTMDRGRSPNIVCNPPFNIFQLFATHALNLAEKVAMIWLVPRLNAARWLQDTPLARVWLLTPRPSMPPGHVIAAGEKPGGGTQDFCWLVWDRAYVGKPTIGWLHRDGVAP